MKRFKTLILHNEPDIRHELRMILARETFLKVIGEAVGASEALELHDNVQYDVIFSGLYLPGVDGLELANILSEMENRPALVLVSHDESGAYQAFERGVTDYLLWPLKPERLRKTVERLRRLAPNSTGKMGAEPEHAPPLIPRDNDTLRLDLAEDEEDSLMNALTSAWSQTPQRQPEIEKLPVQEDGRTVLIPYTRIIYVEADEDYSFVNTSETRYITSYRLKNLEERLKPHRFFRVHRKYLVNLDMVTEIASLPGSNYMLRTAGRNRIELPVSRRRMSDLKQVLGY